DRIFGPVEGTPLPPGAVPRGTPPGPRGEPAPPGTPGAASPPVPSSRPALAPWMPMSNEPPPIAPLDVPAPGELPPPPAAPAPDQANGVPPQVAPSSFGAKTSGPSVATAKYDPRTGRYVGPDGKLYQQSDLVAPNAAKTWQDMFPS